MADSTQDATPPQPNSAVELITTGKISTAVWYLAWPTVIQTFLQTAYMVINMAFVGRLPRAGEALAAVGIGNSVLMIQFGVTIALSVGTSALVSRALGAGRADEADEAMGQSLVMCLVGGILTSIPLILWAKPIVAAIGASGKVAPVSGDYVALISWASVPVFFWTIIVSALRSAGDARSPLYISIAALALNAILDYVLIRGVAGSPRYGVHGAAIATIVARVFGAGLAFWFLTRSSLRGMIAHLLPKWNMSARILGVGWPAAVGNLLWSTAFAGFIRILAALPVAERTAAQAALTVGVRIESFSFMPGLAYSLAAAPLVGQNLGAGRPDRAEHSAWVATGHAAAIMAAVGAAFLIFAGPLTRLFTSELAVVPLAVWYLRINAPSEPFLALAMVLRGGLQGAGDTMVPMLITVTNVWLLRLPLAWLLSVPLGWGAVGAWVAMSATTILSGLMVAAWFKWGTWRTRQV